MYDGYIKNQIRPYLWDVSLGDLSVVDLDRWYVTLKRTGLAPATVRKAHNIVRGALTQGVRWGWITTNVAALSRPPAVPKSAIATPKATEVRDFVGFVAKIDKEFATYVRLSGVTGARPGEVCALQWDDVDFEHSELHQAADHGGRTGRCGRKT